MIVIIGLVILIAAVVAGLQPASCPIAAAAMGSPTPSRCSATT